MKRLIRTSSIRGKLTIWLLALYGLLCFLYAHTFWDRYQDESRIITQNHERTAKLIALSIDSLMDVTVENQLTAGQILVKQKLDADSASNYLNEMCRNREYYLSKSFLNPQGKIIASSNLQLVGMNISSMEDVSLALSGKSPVVSGLYWSAKKERSFAVDTTIQRNGQMMGVVRTEIDASVLDRCLPKDIARRMAVVALDSRSSEVYRRVGAGLHFPAGSLQRLPFVRKSFATKSPSGASLFSVAGDKSEYIGCATPISAGNWNLVATWPARDWLYQARADFIKDLYTSLGLTAAILILFYWQCGIWLTSNIRRLTHGAAALSVGDLTKRIKIRTGDELERLATVFNQMAESLQIRDRQINTRSEALQSLLDVAQVVMSSLDLETVASAISQAVNRRFGARSVALYLFDEGRGELDLFAYQCYALGSSDDPPKEWNLIASQAHNIRQMQVADETHSDSDSQDERLLVSVPLVAGDLPVGVLVGSFVGDDFAETAALEDHLDLLQAFGSHAAVALQNARSYAVAEEYSKSLSQWLDELSALRYVTEAITASLDMREVLQTLARLTCDVMRADACAIMMMDAGGMLKVSEGFNLSPQMRALCECRIGDPLSGLAAAEKRPLPVRDLIEEYPGVKMAVRAAAEGLHGFLSAPLITGREVIGTIDIWIAESREFTSYQMDLLGSIAMHAAMAIQNARLFGKEYRIAETLQSVVLGNVPERAYGLELGSKYAPALEEAHVGGDFYDVLSLPGNRIGVVMADVSGKGLGAAMHTAMCKFMLRGFAYHIPDSPAQTLQMVNDALCGYANSSFFVTVFYCIIDPVSGSITYANAGHPPTISISEGGLRQTLLYQTGMPIGLETGIKYGERTLKFATGDALVMYTDGLIDARNGSDTLSIEGVQDILFSLAGETSPQMLVERLYTEVLQYAKDGIRDDMAIVAVNSIGVNDAAADDLKQPQNETLQSTV